MDREELRKKIIEKIKNDPNNLQKFLKSTGLSFWESDNLGLIELNDFLCHLYNETALVVQKKDEIYRYINESLDKNTFFIVGYQGCGKTTFITALQDLCIKKEITEQTLLIHCDSIATGSNPNKSLIISFRQQIMKYLSAHKQALHCVVDFYDRNTTIFTIQFANAAQIYDLIQNIKDEFTNTNKRNINNAADVIFFMKNILDKLEFKELFYFYCFLFMSNNYNTNFSKKPLVMFIDNLDYFDDFADINSFMQAVNDFTLDMNRDMRNLYLYRESEQTFRYVDKFKLFITMRETTKANIQNEHWAESYRAIYVYYDVSEWFDKDEVINHRLKFLSGDDEAELKDKIKFMRLILNDIETQKKSEREVIFPLYNNDYRIAVDSLSRIIVQHEQSLSEYEKIMNLPDRSLRYGARGMLVRWICDEFILEKGAKENYLKKIGAIDFQNRKNNTVSISRLILAYLSNKTETKCDDSKNCIPFADIIRDFEGIFQEKDIKRSINEMYDLRHARSWSHLISFSQLEKKDKNQPLDNMDNIDYENTTLHYSCAGKIYLEFISSHFEFFAVRTFTDEVKCDALFCKSNLTKMHGDKYKFIHIIEKVFEEAAKCTKSLIDFNKEVCNLINIGDPYKSSDARQKYLASNYIASLKKMREGRVTQKYFHGERFLNTHIGYIDRFRLYLFNYCDDIISLPSPKKHAINETIVEFIEKYVDLLSSVLTDKDTNGLIVYYKNQIDKIKKTGFKDFQIEINSQ
jgi:energy-coupling factor transporter ATP-binding protein EcfA2